MEIEWKREKVIGVGGQALVFLATTKLIPNSNTTQSYYLPPLMAIKSADVDLCCPLIKERRILSQLEGSEYIIKCYGDNVRFERNHTNFNLFLEFAPNGSLSKLIKRDGLGLDMDDIKQYTRSILRGLKHIHDRGFVHRDIKPHNILLCENNVLKIADFGLSTKANKQRRKYEFRLKGTPLYMAPESISYGEYEPSCDIWARGCVVLEMLNGKSAWNFRPKAKVEDILEYIAYSGKSPPIPLWVSSNETKSFIEKCFIRDPKLRWTADMLLSHPFVRADTEIEYDLPRPNFLRSNYRASHIIRHKLTEEETSSTPYGFQRYFCVQKFAEASQSIKSNPTLSGEKRKRSDIDVGDGMEVTDQLVFYM